MAEGRGGVIKLSLITDLTSPIHLQSERHLRESWVGEFNPDRAGSLITPPRPSATPPPAEEGSQSPW